MAGINRQGDRLRLLIPALKNGERIGVVHNLSQSHTYSISCRRKLSACDRLTRIVKLYPAVPANRRITLGVERRTSLERRAAIDQKTGRFAIKIYTKFMLEIRRAVALALQLVG